MSTSQRYDGLPDFLAALHGLPFSNPKYDKSRFFNDWFSDNYKEVEAAVLAVIRRENDPTFDRRMNLVMVVKEVDARKGSLLIQRGFTPTEIERYATRAINKHLQQAAETIGEHYKICRSKLIKLALENKLEHKPAEG